LAAVQTRAPSPSSRAGLLTASLLARCPDAEGRPELGESELRGWEADVHKIASAFSPEACGPQGADGLPLLPCRVDAPGPPLYLSDAASARDPEGLRALGIGAVLNCGAPAFEYPAGIQQLEVRCQDAEGYPLLARHLDECLGFVEHCEQSGGGLLVHCVMGLNRSASVVVACLMLHRGVALLEAVRKVWECRGRSPILTNRSFRRQLVQLAHLAGKLG